MWQYNNIDELYHFGIPGMKWGIRRYQNKDGTLTSAGKKKSRVESDDSKNVKNIRKKHIGEMTNQELRDANNRLQLESNYKDLIDKKNIGKKAVRTFIGVAGTIAAAKVAAKTYKEVSDFVLTKIGKKVIS